MSIRDRLEDARMLSALGRREGAFIHVLIAAAATSRRRYPKKKWVDGEAFKNFIYDEMGIITGGPKYAVAFPFQGKQTPLEDILYHHLRCQLVHEGEMPGSIVFTEPVVEDGRVSHSLHLTTPLGFPAGWIEHLATAVWLAPENDDLWTDESAQRERAREQLGERRHDGLYCRRPEQQIKKKEKISWRKDGIHLSLTYPLGLTPDRLADVLEDKANELRQ